MNSIKRAAAVATIAWVAAIGAFPASADVISNPTNTDSFVYLSGALQGGQQTQFVGQDTGDACVNRSAKPRRCTARVKCRAALNLRACADIPAGAKMTAVGESRRAESTGCAGCRDSES